MRLIYVHNQCRHHYNITKLNLSLATLCLPVNFIEMSLNVEMIRQEICLPASHDNLCCMMRDFIQLESKKYSEATIFLSTSEGGWQKKFTTVKT